MGSWMAIAMMPVFSVLGRGCHLVGLIRLVEVKGKMMDYLFSSFYEMRAGLLGFRCRAVSISFIGSIIEANLQICGSPGLFGFDSALLLGCDGSMSLGSWMMVAMVFRIMADKNYSYSQAWLGCMGAH